MEEKNNLFETLLERAEDYGKTSIELMKLKAIEKISEGASAVASKMIAIFFFLLFFLIGSVGLALWLGEVMGNIMYGFLVLAAFYGLLGAFLFFVRQNWLKKSVGNSIIKQMLN